MRNPGNQTYLASVWQLCALVEDEVAHRSQEAVEEPPVAERNPQAERQDYSTTQWGTRLYHLHLLQ